jgi:hypothetical protein
MFILGFKHDPSFPTPLHAVAAGAAPGLLDVADEIRVYGAIHANFEGFSKVLEALRAQFGDQIPAQAKDEIFKLIMEELTEDHYGGRWFQRGSLPRHWVSMGEFSHVFKTVEAVFCLPAPYVSFLRPIL